MDGSVAMQKNDWTCYKCGVNNFKRRDVCFKCETGREESDANDTGDEISPTPTNCLILRNLSAETTSDQILGLVSSLTNAPIRSLRFPKDPVYNMPRGVCYLDLHTTAEAIQLMALISGTDTSFLVDSAPLIVSYARRLSACPAAASVSTCAASAALAAAQWTNQTASGSSAPQPTSSLGFVNVNGVTYPKFPKPDTSTFQLESSSGFYYDASTRLYYDAKSTYYFNSVTQQYLYWSDEYETYLPPETTSTTAAESQKVEKTPDKVKKAKKIAKDMEKWAKTLNQKTASRSVTDTTASPAAKSDPTDADAFPVEQDNQTKDIIDSEPQMVLDPDAVRREEESKLIDWSKLLCLLCKRQFASPDQLTKHQQVSELHRSNLDLKMRSILSTEQMEALTRRDGQYVDRAEERRKKWGNEEPVEPNPMKEKYLKELKQTPTIEQVQVDEKPINDSNKGSRLLKKMGWQEGQGLGKKNTGRVDFVRLNAHHENAGLGLGSQARPTVALPGESYKDAVKRAMAQRYKELNSE